MRARLLVGLLLVSSTLACSGEQGRPGKDGTGGPGPVGHSAWFTGPGVRIDATQLTVAAGGASVEFTLADGAGAPLDQAGRLTEGAVAVSFALAQLAPDGGAGTYVPYTTTTDVSEDGATEVTQGALEAAGTVEVVDVLAGKYRYRFAAPLAGLDASRTQTVVAVASRTFRGAAYTGSDLLSVVPAGGAPAARAVADEARCASCHGTVTAHGGRFTGLAQCAVCHAGPAADADTGNALALDVLLHKLHRGAALPSVVAGTPYALVGAADEVHDYSTVRFPRAVQHCAACHAGATSTARPTATACLSCHDRTSFVDPPAEGLTVHGGGAVADLGSCGECHDAANVTARHLHPSFDPSAPRLALDILNVANTAPGQQPTLTFRVTVNGAPRDILAPGLALSSLRATFAGPNTDYAIQWEALAQSDPLLSGITAVDGEPGTFRWTMPPADAIPAAATGSYTVALEGAVLTGSEPSTVRHAAFSPVRAILVTGSSPVPRRTIVEAARCDACHLDLAAHAGSRKNPAYCAMCHNPASYNDERAARLEGASVVAESVDLRVMIHKIHAGVALTQPYVLYANPAPTAFNPLGTPRDFGVTRYPRPLTDCSACHVDGTWGLPVESSRASVFAEMTCLESAIEDDNQLCQAPNFVVAELFALPPAAAACTGCHDAPDVAIHAQLETTAAGEEGCATCHGPGSTWDAVEVHAR